MNLERNLIDNILECGVKIGQIDMAMTFYYPLSSLYELLEADSTNLDSKVAEFCEAIKDTLGLVKITEVKGEKGRFGINVPAAGVKWVNNNFEASKFCKEFVAKINSMDATVDEIISLFKSFDPDCVIDKVDEHETALWFTDDSVDPYVYFLEENDFGLEYHRYTKKAYEEGTSHA